MTRNQALEAAIAALGELMVICGEYGDLETARTAAQAQRALIALRSPSVARAMEQARGLG